MLPILHSSAAGLLAYAGPLLAAGLGLLGGLLCRSKALRALLPAVGAGAALVGWAVLVPAPVLWRALLAPRFGPELLLAPAAYGLILLLVAAWWRGRLERWAPIVIAVFAGWWLAGSPGGRGEFWRVWAATGALAWVLAKLVSGQPFRGLAAGAALWGGLALTGAPAGWAAAAAVGAGASAGLLAAGTGAVVPAGLLAALFAGADLAGGRLVRAGVSAVDLACVAACAAPLLAGVIAPRARRLGPLGPVAAALAAAACAAGAAWIAHRAMRP